jgi:hypothetical protein
MKENSSFIYLFDSSNHFIFSTVLALFFICYLLLSFVFFIFRLILTIFKFPFSGFLFHSLDGDDPPCARRPDKSREETGGKKKGTIIFTIILTT